MSVLEHVAENVRRLRTDAERTALTVPFVPVADGLRARFPIVLAL